MKLFNIIEIVLCIAIVTGMCTLLSALMVLVDKLCNYSSDINNCSDVVLQAFGVKAQLILTIFIHYY